MQILHEFFVQIITLLVSCGNILFFFRITKRMKKAEANKVEIENEKSFAEEWKKIAEDREIKIVSKDAKIDGLYIELSEWRDKYNTLLTEVNDLKIKNTNLEFRACNRRMCENREPQTGF